MNLAQVCFRTTPERPALVFLPASGRAVRLSSGELQRRVLALAAGVTAAGGSGPVLIRLSQGVDYAAAFLAAIAAGRISVPLSPMLTATEVQWIAHNSQADAAFVDESLPFPDLKIQRIDPAQCSKEAASGFVPMDPEDPAFLVYTSGTSGMPRGVLHAQRIIFARIPMAGWTGLGPEDRVFHAGALNWTYTLGVGLMDPLREGACAVLAEPPAELDRYLSILADEHITIFAAVPGLFRRILKYADFKRHDLSRLRHCLTAGSALSEELYAAWKKASGRELFEALGMTEISTYISSGPAVPVHPGSPGKIQHGRKAAIVDPETGEPLAQGKSGVIGVHREEPGLMLGYWQNPGATRSAFRGDYFITGDLAFLDSDNYIHYEGRADEMMNASGYRVSPLEIEKILLLHEAVAEAACAEAAPPGTDITIVCAFIVLKPGFHESVRTDILEFAGGFLARYKMPREIVFLKELPRNANGKLLRKNLRLPDTQ